MSRIDGALAEGAWMVLVVGPPGVGKTYRVRRYADTENRGDAVLASLVAARTREAVVRRVAAAMALPSAERGPLEGVQADALTVLGARRNALLILDSAEECFDVAVGVAREWRQTCARLRVLLTSRHRERADDAVMVEVSPLGFQEAAALFALRAREVAPDLDVEAEAERIERIVELVDRLPLAIELAASRMQVLGTKQLEERLRERLDTVRSPSRGAVGEERDLEVALLRSWELLSPNERSVLAQCSLFEGSFSIESAEAVVAVSGADATVLDTLHELCRRSLVQSRTSEELEGERRLSLFNSVRLFARDRLEGDEAEQARDRFVQHFVSRAQRWNREYEAEIPRSLRHFSAEIGNLQAAHTLLSATRPEDAAELVTTMGDYLKHNHPSAEATRLLESAFRSARSKATLAQLHFMRAQVSDGSYEVRLEDAETAYRLSLESDQAVFRVRTLSQIALMNLHIGDLVRAREMAERGLRDAREVGADNHVYLLMDRLAQVSFLSGRFREAGQLWGELLKLRRPEANNRGVALAMGNLGDAMIELGEYGRAERSIEGALQMHDEVGDRRSIAVARLNLGRLWLNQGRPEQALDAATGALATFRGLDERWEGLCLEMLACVHLERGDLARARTSLEDALRRAESIGHRRHQRSAWRRLALCELLAGAADEALRSVGAASALGSPRELGFGMNELYVGLALLASGRDSEAVDSLREAVDLLRISDGLAATCLAAAAEGAAQSPQPASSLVADTDPEASRSWEVRMVNRIARSLSREGAASGSSLALELGREGRWFRLSSRDARVELGRRRNLRVLLSALVEARAAQPGAPVSAESLFAAVWPDTTIARSSALNRLRVALSTLRRLGLDEVLETRADGYLIRPEVRIRFARD